MCFPKNFADVLRTPILKKVDRLFLLVWCMLFFTNRGSRVYTFQLRTFDPNKTVNKKKSSKCKKQGIKNFLLLYYIQVKCGDIADKSPNAADSDEQTFNYRRPNKSNQLLGFSISRLANVEDFFHVNIFLKGKYKCEYKRLIIYIYYVVCYFKLCFYFMASSAQLTCSAMRNLN